MKSAAIWILRYLLIPAGFLWAAGIFNLFSLVSGSEDYQDPFSTFSEEEFCTLEITPQNFHQYCDSIKKERTNLIENGGLYTPYLYFYDLKQFYMFEAKYRDSLERGSMARERLTLHVAQVDWKKQVLVGIRNHTWHRVDWDEIALNHPGEKEYANITDARGYWFPRNAEEEKRTENLKWSEIWSKIFFALFSWFTGFYLKGLPIAFVLFMIWRIKLKTDTKWEYWGEENSKPKFESSFAPLSFLLSLVLWPIIVYRNLRDLLSNNLRKAELLARRKDMLSLLSKQDRELYALSKQMSLGEFRRYLDSLGLKRKHSFGVALLAAVFFISAIRATAGVKYVVNEDRMVSSVVLENDVGSIYFFIYDAHAALQNTEIRTKIQKAKSIFSSLRYKAVKGFARIVDGVPKVLNQFTT